MNKKYTVPVRVTGWINVEVDAEDSTDAENQVENMSTDELWKHEGGDLSFEVNTAKEVGND
jgi:hypothetical protein